MISQEDDLVFNRAMLFNVGYMEAMQVSDWDCLGQSLSLTVINSLTVSLVFHDVDLIPEDDRNLYTCPRCPSQPRHMSVAMDKFNYTLPYQDYFGGVAAISVRHFSFVNGFSNQFWGWGGEDDDMARRLRMNNLTVTRSSPHIARWDEEKQGLLTSSCECECTSTEDSESYWRMRTLKCDVTD